jgi:hypothetical protein
MKKSATWEIQAETGDKINEYLKELGWEGAEWINLAQDKGKAVAHKTIEFHTMRRIS